MAFGLREGSVSHKGYLVMVQKLFYSGYLNLKKSALGTSWWSKVAELMHSEYRGQVRILVRELDP